MNIRHALKTFTSVPYLYPDAKGRIGGMRAIMIHDATDPDISEADPSRRLPPILKIPVTEDGTDAEMICEIAEAAQTLSNYSAEARVDYPLNEYDTGRIDRANKILARHGLSVTLHPSSGKDGTFNHCGYVGYVDGVSLHLQMEYDT